MIKDIPYDCPVYYAEEIRKGEEIARLLQLKPAKGENRRRFSPERYETSHGTKTALGLYRTLCPFFMHNPA
jgi:hypothetical protein